MPFDTRMCTLHGGKEKGIFAKNCFQDTPLTSKFSEKGGGVLDRGAKSMSYFLA